MFDHSKEMDRLLTLPACTLITTGRTGTDLLQSLLDSHPQVLMFNGHIQFFDFWRHSKVVAAGNMRLDDFLDEFIGRYIERFKSRYDLEERKDQLGANGDQTIDIDIPRFKNEVALFVQGRTTDPKNTIVAIYAAYAVCIGQDITTKKLFFHHQHNVELIDLYLAHFPHSKIICMTRDPRANFVSGVENWRRYDPGRDHGRHLFVYIKRILADADVLKAFPNNPYIVIRIEDLGNKAIIHKLCQWLGIDDDDCLNESTWAGLRWKGDKLSKGANAQKGFDPAMLKNSWEDKLGGIDKYVLNFIMNERLKHYHYPYRPIGGADRLMVLPAIAWPLLFEWRFCSPSYVGERLRCREYKRLASNFWYYIKRKFLFWKYAFRTIKEEPFTHPYLTEDGLF